MAASTCDCDQRLFETTVSRFETIATIHCDSVLVGNVVSARSFFCDAEECYEPLRLLLNDQAAAII